MLRLYSKFDRHMVIITIINTNHGHVACCSICHRNSFFFVCVSPSDGSELKFPCEQPTLTTSNIWTKQMTKHFILFSRRHGYSYGHE